MKRLSLGLLGLFGLLSVHEDNHDTDLMPEIVCPACLRKIEDCRCVSLPSKRIHLLTNKALRVRHHSRSSTQSSRSRFAAPKESGARDRGREGAIHETSF